MLVRSIRVLNYKSFADSGPVELGEGFNVLVGQNNFGKTALLQALRTTNNATIPHKDPTISKEVLVRGPSRFDLKLQVSAQELQMELFNTGREHFWIPVPQSGTRQSLDFAQDIMNRDGATVIISYQAEGGRTSPYPSHGLFEHNTRENQIGASITPNQRDRVLQFNSLAASNGDDLPELMDGLARRSIFSFDAERRGPSKIGLASAPKLLSDASNLPRALFEMQSSHDLWREFNNHVNHVLPSIRWIDVGSPGGNDVEPRIWPVDPSTRRDDLVSTLDRSGTGVAQVLAILCAAMTNTRAVIGIDEPGNFLHPGAVKALIGILKQFEHQYVVTTHSLDALLIANPRHVHFVEWANCVSTVRRANLHNVDDHRRLLANLGVSLADVFGMDTVLWVEGETEEVCLPIILQDALGYTPSTTVIVRVRSTSEVADKKKSKKLVWDVYKRLSDLGGLLPTKAKFLFDREERSEDDLADLERESAGAIKFIGRRTFENYFLSAPLLFAELAAEAQALGIDPLPTQEALNDWLANNAATFCPKGVWKGDIEDAEWLVKADAPSLLNAMFKNFVSAEFDKARHSPSLTRRLIAQGGEGTEALKQLLLERVRSH